MSSYARRAFAFTAPIVGRRVVNDAYNYATGKGRYVRPSPNLLPRIRRLEAELSRQRPELQQFRANAFLTTTAIIANDYDLNVTQVFIDDADFRDKVTGDKWYNKKLNIRLNSLDAGIAKVRVIVYIPQNTDSTLTLTAGYQYTQIPDSTAWKILHDACYDKPYSTALFYRNIHVNLGNALTLYNSDASLLDKNPIKCKFIWQSTNTTAFRVTTGLYFTNK